MRLDPPFTGGAGAGAGGGAAAGGAGGAGVAGAGVAGAGVAGAGGADFPNPKSPDIEFNKLFDPPDISVLS